MRSASDRYIIFLSYRLRLRRWWRDVDLGSSQEAFQSEAIVALGTEKGPKLNDLTMRDRVADSGIFERWLTLRW